MENKKPNMPYDQAKLPSQPLDTISPPKLPTQRPNTQFPLWMPPRDVPKPWDPFGPFGSFRTFWDPLGSHGIPWDSLGSLGTPWNPLGPLRMPWGNTHQNIAVMLRLDTMTHQICLSTQRIRWWGQKCQKRMGSRPTGPGNEHFHVLTTVFFNFNGFLLIAITEVPKNSIKWVFLSLNMINEAHGQLTNKKYVSMAPYRA